MGDKRVYACGRCGDEVDPENARRMGGRYFHFECPEQTFERILKELEDE